MRGRHLAILALVSCACGAALPGAVPAGAPDASAQSGTDGAAGTGQPGRDADAGTVVGGSGGGLDTPADGGPAPAQCEELADPPPEPVVHATLYSRRAGHCGLAWSDGQGDVALEVSQLDDHPRWDLLSPAGTRLGSADAWRGVLFPSIRGYIIEQGNSGGPSSSPDIQGIDSAGRLRADTQVEGGPLVVPSERGELLVLGSVAAAPAPPLPFPWVVWVLRDDATTLWGPRPLSMQSATVGGGIDAAGRVLVLQDGTAAFGAGTTAAQWFDQDGSALTSPFLLLESSAARPSARLETSPLIGGGLAIRRVTLDDASGVESSEWLVTVAAGRSSPAPAPQWLRSRPNTTLATISGDRYAVLPLGGDVSPCAQAVDVVSASGGSCARVVFPIDGGQCRTRDLRRGLDGTVLQMLPADREPFVQPPDVHACTLRFWPAALR